MPRHPRLFVPGIVYHIISRGSGKQTVFHDVEDYEKYLEILLSTKREYGIEIFHYCLMPNHVHLLVRASRENGSSFMQKLNHSYSKYACKKLERIGHVWRNRFRSLKVDNDAYLLACGNYIEMNPVRAGITAAAGEWKYSSFRFYADGWEDAVVDADPMYRDFGAIPQERMERYRRWIGTTRSETSARVPTR